MRVLFLALALVAAVVVSQIGRAEAPLVNVTCPQGYHLAPNPADPSYKVCVPD